MKTPVEHTCTVIGGSASLTACAGCSSDDASLYRMPARERYLKDAEFHQLVDMMRAMIHRVQFSPSEIREAALLACVIYEETQTRSVYTRAAERMR